MSAHGRHLAYLPRSQRGRSDSWLQVYPAPIFANLRAERLEEPACNLRNTETFDYADAKAPKLLELTGQPKKNTVGITKTLQLLAKRFS